MGLVKVFEVRENDSDQQLHFWLVELDGTAWPIPDLAVVTFEAYLDGASEMTVSDTDHVTVPLQGAGDVGHCFYTTQVEDFVTGDAGRYWCRILVDTITAAEVELQVKSEYSDGE